MSVFRVGARSLDLPRWRERRERVRRGASRRKRVARRAEALSQSQKNEEAPFLDEAEAADDEGILQVPLPPDPLGMDANGLITAPGGAKTSGGFWQRMMSRLRKPPAPQSPQPSDGAAAEDPVRRILAVPRGAARLDAFQNVLRGLRPGTHGHRGVALAFHRELVTLSTRAQVDLTLLRNRVEFCAECLLQAGEAEKAAHLLAKVGKKRRAADLFVAAGAIDALEEVHAALDEGAQGEHLSARLAYERFDTLFAAGQRNDALAALEQAIAHWPENGTYAAIAERFRAQIPCGRLALRLRTQQGAELHLSVQSKWPLSVGRNEGNALCLASPLISREHLEILRRDQEIWVQDRVGRADCEIDGQILRDAQALLPVGSCRIAGLDLHYAQKPGHLYLECPTHRRALAGLSPQERAYCLMEDWAADGLWLKLDERGCFILCPKTHFRLAGETLTTPLLLMTGDRIVLGEMEVCVENAPSDGAFAAGAEPNP